MLVNNLMISVFCYMKNILPIQAGSWISSFRINHPRSNLLSGTYIPVTVHDVSLSKLGMICIIDVVWFERDMYFEIYFVLKSITSINIFVQRFWYVNVDTLVSTGDEILFSFLFLELEDLYYYNDRLVGLGVSVSDYWPRRHWFDSRHFHNFKCGLDLERGPPSLVRTIG